MAIIKSHNAETLLKEALVLDLGDVIKQAQQIREDAQAKARSLVSEAQRDAEMIRKSVFDETLEKGFEQGQQQGLKEGREQGLEQGRQEAFDQSNKQLQQLQEAWSQALEQWGQQRDDLLRDARGAVLELAVRLAEKLVYRVIQVDPGVVVDQLSAVLSHVLRSTEVTVHINGDDRAVLEDAMPQLMAGFSHIQQAHLVDDPAVNRGGCRVSYGQGQIDATIQTQLQRLAELIAPGQSLEQPPESLDNDRPDAAPKDGQSSP